MKSNAHKTAWVVATLVLLWCMAAWVIARSYYLSRADELIQQETRLAQVRAQDLADSIQRNLNYLSGIPNLFSHGLRFNNAVSRFGTSVIPSTLPYEAKKKRWTADPVLNDLNRFLAKIEATLNVDLVYVVDAAGDCIAASNWNTPGSSIGTNFAERDFFRMNKGGRRGMQFAVGKTTHIPGLYFSSPVIVNGQFMGAVVAKVDVPNLSSLIKNMDAYVADKNGVIILAHDKEMEMLSLPGAPVRKMSQQAREDIYAKSDLPELQMTPWEDKDFAALLQIHGEIAPHVLASIELPEYGLTVYVEGDLPALPLLKQDRLWFGLLLGVVGSILILAVAAVMFYVQSIRRTKDVLQESEMRLKESQRIAKLGVWELDLVTNSLSWSDEIFRIFEIDKAQFGASYEAFLNAIHPDDRERVNKAYTEHLANRTPYEITHRLRMADGRTKYVIERCHSDFDAKGKPLRSLGTVQDVTESKQVEESMQLAALISQSSAEAVMVTDENNLIVDVNPAFTRQTGYTLEEVIGKNPRVLQSGRHDNAFYQDMWQAISKDGHWQGEVWDRRKDGTLHAKFVSISVIRHPDGGIYRHVAQFFDITDKKQKEELIWRQANFDALTELPNRRLLHDRLEQESKKAHRTGSSLALLFIDLDRFKEVNDTLGHAKGDMLLVEAARRISRGVRETDTVARLGGDEFTVMLTEFGERVHLERIAQDIVQVLSKPYDLGNGDTGYISASIGIALYPDDAKDLAELMKHADQAMYAAKAEGRNRFSYFIPSMQQEAQEKLTLTNDLRQALARNELEVFYQPIVDAKRGELHKAEALLRWKHPKRGMVSPDVFIPLAEESGLILEIGEWVFQEVIASIARWRNQFGRIIRVSVNMSPVQFEQSTRNKWMDKLVSAGLPGNSITVEITEGLLIKDSSKVKQQLLEFRNSGIEVSIDDFGTGFSALSYLKMFDIDYLKIDRSFVSHLNENESDKALTEAIIVMAHKLGIKTIAEGVETEAQLYLLIAFDCDYVQGYLYSRPVPAEEFGKMLEK